VEPDEPLHGRQVGRLRVHGEISKLHLPDHFLPRFGHGDTSFAWGFKGGESRVRGTRPMQ
jgi:hypothetical protein